jgi:hypothetical protein
METTNTRRTQSTITVVSTSEMLFHVIKRYMVLGGNNVFLSREFLEKLAIVQHESHL